MMNFKDVLTFGIFIIALLTFVFTFCKLYIEKTPLYFTEWRVIYHNINQVKPHFVERLFPLFIITLWTQNCNINYLLLNCHSVKQTCLWHVCSGELRMHSLEVRSLERDNQKSPQNRGLFDYLFDNFVPGKHTLLRHFGCCTGVTQQVLRAPTLYVNYLWNDPASKTVSIYKQVIYK